MIQHIFSVILDPTTEYDLRDATIQLIPGWTRPEVGVVGRLVVFEMKRNSRKEPQNRKYALFCEGLTEEGDCLFRFTKQGDIESYNVKLSRLGQEEDSCDCRAFERLRRCVHSQSLRKLHQRSAI